MDYDAIASRIKSIQSNPTQATPELISLGFKSATGSGLSEDEKKRVTQLKNQEPR